MTWFWIALVGPLVWSLSNHIDKLLLSKYFNNQSHWPLVAISAFAGVFVAAPLGIYLGSVELPLAYIMAFMAVGALEICYLIPYFKALEKGEASMVAPVYQLIPVLYFVTAYIFLGETLTMLQILGGGVVFTGAFLASLDTRTFRWNWSVFFLILLSSLIVVVSGVLFKDLALDAHFLRGLFWQNVGAVLIGVLLFVLPAYRRSYWALVRQSRLFFTANIFNEIISLVGFIAMRYAGFIAPLALAQAVNGFQPLFIFLWGAIGTLLFPRLGFQEDLSRTAVVKKVVAAIFLLVGAWMIK